jgi:S-formylglutathione hydrolase FrmB
MRASTAAAWCLSLLASAAPAAAEWRSETFRSPSLGTDVSVGLHLPPSYGSGRGDFPAVYALHGLFEGAGFWERRGLRAQLDALWAAGALPEFVVVAVDGGNSFFVNGPLGRYEDLVIDTVDWAEGRLRLKHGRGQRGLWGVSMGGYAGLRLALHRPETFGAVVTHSAMLLERPPTREDGAGRWQMDAFQRAFGNPIDARLWSVCDPLALAASASPSALPALRFDCGAEDRYGLSAGNRRLHELLRARGVAHEFELPPGDHGYDYVRTVFERGLRFLTTRWAPARAGAR